MKAQYPGRVGARHLALRVPAQPRPVRVVLAVVAVGVVAEARARPAVQAPRAQAARVVRGQAARVVRVPSALALAGPAVAVVAAAARFRVCRWSSRPTTASRRTT